MSSSLHPSRLTNSLCRYAYKNGATVGITAPTIGSRGFIAGLGVAFNTGAPHKLATGAVLQDITALHVAIGERGESISTKIGALRALLYGASGEGELKIAFKKVVNVSGLSISSIMSMN